MMLLEASCAARLNEYLRVSVGGVAANSSGALQVLISCATSHDPCLPTTLLTSVLLQHECNMSQYEHPSCAACTWAFQDICICLEKPVSGFRAYPAS